LIRLGYRLGIKILDGTKVEETVVRLLGNVTIAADGNPQVSFLQPKTPQWNSRPSQELKSRRMGEDLGLAKTAQDLGGANTEGKEK